MLLIKFSDNMKFSKWIINEDRATMQSDLDQSVTSSQSKKKKESSADPNINLLLELSSTDCVQDLQTNGECLSGKYG